MKTPTNCDRVCDMNFTTSELNDKKSHNLSEYDCYPHLASYSVQVRKEDDCLGNRDANSLEHSAQSSLLT